MRRPVVLLFDCYTAKNIEDNCHVNKNQHKYACFQDACSLKPLLSPAYTLILRYIHAARAFGIVQLDRVGPTYGQLVRTALLGTVDIFSHLGDNCNHCMPEDAVIARGIPELLSKHVAQSLI